PIGRSHYYVPHAYLAGTRGDAQQAYANFESALEELKDENHPHRTVSVWNHYGHLRQELGDCIGAKNCFEQGLFVAQQFRVPWLITQLHLNYAQLLSCIGQSSTAYPYLLDVLSSLPELPYILVNLACVGIPLALKMGDKNALTACADPIVLD